MTDIIIILIYGAFMLIAVKEGKLKMRKPKISKFLEPVQHKYPTLGIFLGVPQGRIKELEVFAGNSSRCLEKMLEIYIREKDPDVESLVEAVANVRMKALSDT